MPHGDAQAPAPPAAPQSFEVASIKANKTGGESRRAGASPGGVFTASNVSLRLLISRAYGVTPAQIEGGPRWIDTETWDIAAKADTPRELTREELRPCLQALLAEQFQLRTHAATRQSPIFELRLAKNGPKLQPHAGPGNSQIGASSGPEGVTITGIKTPPARLAEYLGAQLGRPVRDGTGLSGDYDFRLAWSTDDASGASIFSALQEQLGLKLESTTGPLELIVIDNAARPVL